MNKKYLITGGFGFLGSNIASEILKTKDELIIFDSLFRVGTIENKKWLENQGKFTFIHGDVRNQNDVERIIKHHRPDIIYHLAGQVAMTTSIANPRMDFEVNVLGTFNLLEAVRLHAPESTVIYSSTNKVYGDLEQFSFQEGETRYVCQEHPNGFDESINLEFHSPYGSSKGSADQYMLDYARIFKLKTVVFRHSSMYGGRQFATYEQGWIGWFIQKALEIKGKNLKEELTISGNGKQVRDLLYASDMVRLYIDAAFQIDKIKGHAFNIGGGIDNSSSILELLRFLEDELNIEIKFKQINVRESDQKVFIANINKVTRMINWKPCVSKEEGLKKMIKWVNEDS